MIELNIYYDKNGTLRKGFERQNVKDCLIQYIEWLLNNDDVICSNPDHLQKAKEIFGEDIFK